MRPLDQAIETSPRKQKTRYKDLKGPESGPCRRLSVRRVKKRAWLECYCRLVSVRSPTTDVIDEATNAYTRWTFRMVAVVCCPESRTRHGLQLWWPIIDDSSCRVNASLHMTQRLGCSHFVDHWRMPHQAARLWLDRAMASVLRSMASSSTITSKNYM